MRLLPRRRAAFMESPTYPCAAGAPARQVADRAHAMFIRSHARPRRAMARHAAPLHPGPRSRAVGWSVASVVMPVPAVLITLALVPVRLCRPPRGRATHRRLHQRNAPLAVARSHLRGRMSEAVAVAGLHQGGARLSLQVHQLKHGQSCDVPF